jgi:hypothetical protein
MFALKGWHATGETMGLLDILNGMQHGPRGPSAPSDSNAKGGMSPMTMAILARSHTRRSSITAAVSREAAPLHQPHRPTP